MKQCKHELTVAIEKLKEKHPKDLVENEDVAFLITLLTEEGNYDDELVAEWAEDDMESEDDDDGTYLSHVDESDNQV